jgi:hypothetical protein
VTTPRRTVPSVIPVKAVRRALAIVTCCVAALLGSAATAAADAPSAGGDVQVALTLGDRELTVIVRRVTGVPGPARVDVITHAGTAPGTVRLELTPTSVGSSAPSLPASGTVVAESALDLGAAPGSYGSTLRVDRPGSWELALDDGKRTARIPFLVPVQATTPPELAVYAGFVAAGILFLVMLVVATRARRIWWALVPAGGVVAAASVALTGAVLSASLPPPPQPGQQIDPTIDNVTRPYATAQPPLADFSRPPVNLIITSPPEYPGRPSQTTLTVTDAATGRTVDDLLVHDSALMHLLIVGPSGRLWHLHPARTAPGVYDLDLTFPDAGHYAVSAEIARRGGGVQQVRSPGGIDITARSTSGPAAAPVAADAAHITTDGLVAGSVSRITVHFGGTADLQRWLGMLGHMIVVGPLPASAEGAVGAATQVAPVWAHAHSMTGSSGSVTGRPVNGDSAPDETVAAYGPDVPFTFTFPAPGRYRIWIQAEREYSVMTVPAVLDIAPPPTIAGP